MDLQQEQEFLYKLKYNGSYTSWVKYILIKESEMNDIKKFLSIHFLGEIHNTFLWAKQVETSSSKDEHKAIIKFLRKQKLMGDDVFEDLKYACKNHNFKNVDGTIINKCHCDWRCQCGEKEKCKIECKPFLLNFI